MIVLCSKVSPALQPVVSCATFSQLHTPSAMQTYVRVRTYTSGTGIGMESTAVMLVFVPGVDLFDSSDYRRVGQCTK